MNEHDDPADPDLEALLRGALRAVAETTPVSERDATSPGASGRRRRTAATAAAAVLVVGVGGFVLVLVRDGGTAPGAGPVTEPAMASTPASMGEELPVLLGAPDDLEGLDVTFESLAPAANDHVQGAVRTPRGGVIGLYVQPQVGRIGDGPPDGEARQVGDRVVSGDLAEGDEIGNETYFWQEDCAAVALTTSEDLEIWTADLVTFVELVTITDGAVTVELPRGWQNLGADTAGDQYNIEFSADIDGVAHDFVLTQQPDTSVGVFLGHVGLGTPRSVTLAGDPAWLLSRAEGGYGPEGGWTFVVFDYNGTAVSFGGHDVTDEELLTVAALLVARPRSDTADVLNPHASPVQSTEPTGLTDGPAPSELPSAATDANDEPVPTWPWDDCTVSLQLVETGG